MEERRITDIAIWRDTTAILAVLYTIGYFGMVFLLMWQGIPVDNKDAINQLLGAMTIIQTSIVAYYFGGSRAVDVTQRQAMVNQAKTNEVIADIAKAVPAVAAGAVTPGPVMPDGVVPAAKVVKP